MAELLSASHPIRGSRAADWLNLSVRPASRMHMWWRRIRAFVQSRPSHDGSRGFRRADASARSKTRAQDARFEFVSASTGRTFQGSACWLVGGFPAFDFIGEFAPYGCAVKIALLLQFIGSCQSDGSSPPAIPRSTGLRVNSHGILGTDEHRNIPGFRRCIMANHPEPDPMQRLPVRSAPVDCGYCVHKSLERRPNSAQMKSVPRHQVTHSRTGSHRLTR